MNKVADEEESDFGGTRADNDMTTDQEPVKLFRFKFKSKKKYCLCQTLSRKNRYYNQQFSTFW